MKDELLQRGDVVVISGRIPGTPTDVEGEIGVIIKAEERPTRFPYHVIVGEKEIRFWLEKNQVKKIDNFTEEEMKEARL